MNRFVIPLLTITTIALVCIGCIMITSTGVWSAVQNAHEFQDTQLLCANLGIALGICAFFFKTEWTIKLAPILFIIGVILLILCYIKPIGVETNFSYRWVKFPGLPKFQASEIAKITSLIGLAAWYARFPRMENTFIKGFVYPGCLIGIPILLIFFEQDMDTAAALAVVAGIAMFINGVRVRYLLIAAAIAISIGTILVQQSDNRMRRFRAFTQLENYNQSDRETRDANRQQWHALNAFSNGGLNGVGLGEGQQKHGYMPEAHTDFVLAVTGEELGLKMTLTTLILYVIIGLSGFYIAMKSRKIFSRILAASLTLIVLIPAMINMTVVTAAMPVAGLPLPFISYGGTNLIFSTITIGIIMSIHRETLKETIHDVPTIPQHVSPCRL